MWGMAMLERETGVVFCHGFKLGCMLRIKWSTGKPVAAFTMHMIAPHPQTHLYDLVTIMWALGKQMGPEECDLINTLVLENHNTMVLSRR